ncbi:MAG TPA: hypothetical protein VFS55_08560 [Dokdonella sp.]|nr:hypothetical protein [Dokdonella sp.]
MENLQPSHTFAYVRLLFELLVDIDPGLRTDWLSEHVSDPAARDAVMRLVAADRELSVLDASMLELARAISGTDAAPA